MRYTKKSLHIGFEFTYEKSLYRIVELNLERSHMILTEPKVGNNFSYNIDSMLKDLNNGSFKEVTYEIF